jgi:hypothetical protein
MKILVSDLGGVLYSFDPTFSPKKHEQEFVRGLTKVERLDSSLKGVADEFTRGIITKRTLQAECLALEKGILKVFPIFKGAVNLVKNLKTFQLVVVATSLKKSSEFILGQIDPRIKADYIFDVSDYGSKKDWLTWKKIFAQLPRVDVIVEDGEKNLEAAGLAARELGLTPQLFASMPRLHAASS